ncbi:MAG: flagellin [Pseudomonadota bacterium]|uniref:Flagellin n=1 Tax=Alteromonas alba TaxID=2079529 RepID=A0A2S9VET1_9ALTE|nr:flagellin [Alteromonas alba]MDY6928501.1 flagellin [Pseudomonadota bacterium]PRO74805.1 flagellin [Alteromonas alba]
MINFNADKPVTLLDQVQQRQEKLSEQLASGKQVNSAADGAAAQQIIDRLTSEVEGNRQAVSNAYDGLALAQVAEGGLDGINNDVNRIRELTIQSGNGILNDADRDAIQAEITQLQDNIAQTVEQTTFAGKSLLSDEGSLDFQVGSQAGQQISVDTQDIGGQLSDVLSVDITSQPLEQALAAADSAIETVDGVRGDLAAVQSQFESAARNLTQTNVNQAAARSRIQDTDYAQAVSQQASNDVLGQASIAVQTQANQRQGQVLSLLNS